MNSIEEKRKFDYRYIICIVITLGIGLGLGYLFRASFLRLWEAIKDFGLSIAYYFCELFEIEYTFNLTINDYSDKIPRIDFPATFDDFKLKFSAFWEEFGKVENFFDYLFDVSKLLKTVSYFIVLGLPLVLAISILIKNTQSDSNNDYAKESKSLKGFKKIGEVVYQPTKKWFLAFIDFCREHNFFKIWLIELIVVFNVATVIVEFMAYYFYFAAAWDVGTIFLQIHKLLIDLMPTLKFIPVIVWIIIGLLIFCSWRKKIGYMVLRHNELKNRGFINARPIVIMNCGTMGSGKTTMAVDMALSLESMFRDKALEIMIELDLLFPFFPWIKLENMIKKLGFDHVLYNLSTINDYMNKLEYTFLAPSEETISLIQKDTGDLFDEDCIWGYDYERYGLFASDELKQHWLFDILREYAKAYFIYIVESTYLFSNLSIRNDDRVIDMGNLPIWVNDFFKIPVNAPSRFAHIMDFDALRLGKKMIEDNNQSNFFEFGIVLITEIGKERGNALENQELKKKTNECNQKNDRFNDFLKMIRHSATVWNFPFVRVITDEQRPSSWGADARELCDIVRIKQRSDRKLAIPFFGLENALYEILKPKFDAWYTDYRMRRADYSLVFYLKKLFYTKFFNYYLKKTNIFGYYKLSVNIEDGADVEKSQNNYYYLSRKKIYSDRFRSDCFSDFFYSKSKSSGFGLDDIPEFDGVLARIDELQLMNSYFFNNLECLLHYEEESH